MADPRDQSTGLIHGADQDVSVRVIDFTNAGDMRRYLAMLDAYVRDPMGADRSLPAAVKARLAVDLPAHAGAHGLLAERADEALGFATCFIGYSTFQARPLLNIHDIAVLPAWRGRGIADSLLAGIEELAVALGCCRITLEVRDDNPRARRVYARTGFVPAQCSLFMEKALP